MICLHKGYKSIDRSMERSNDTYSTQYYTRGYLGVLMNACIRCCRRCCCFNWFNHSSISITKFRSDIYLRVRSLPATDRCAFIGGRFCTDFVSSAGLLGIIMARGEIKNNAWVTVNNDFWVTSEANSHCRYEMVSRPSYLYDWNSWTARDIFLHWNGSSLYTVEIKELAA